MRTYNEITNFIGEKIPTLALAEQVVFLQKLIYQFANDLPDTWLDNELDSEKPHYQTIFDQINEQTWQPEIIERQLSALDDIMWQMGENYPHSTTNEILLLIELLDNWLILLDIEQKSQNSDNLAIISAISFINYFDELVEIATDELANPDTWLDYPQTAKGFTMITIALAKQL